MTRQNAHILTRSQQINHLDQHHLAGVLVEGGDPDFSRDTAAFQHGYDI